MNKNLFSEKIIELENFNKNGIFTILASN